ncbi:MAG: maleate cis-trans isomerase [Candidatus Tectomicrobia bacterium]|uniref:Maleate cis-trans isomerase n=1 Tax=Tectimicrobiota bacterium TaxID=2528274 RepID=A0A932HY02_UNCTE|nr:maleate cis-trans isomerase [Candidatus Tectomicrobia bacterium]
MDWVKKLGFIVPSWNTVMEYECARMAPEGVSVHFTRIHHTNDEEETLLRMIHEVPHLAELLGHARLDAICFGCTGGSFVRPGMDLEITQVIQEKTGIPATTTATALVEAMREMGIAKVAVASPYPQWLNDRLGGFLKDHGIAVVREKGQNVECPAFLPPGNAEALAREVDAPEAEGIFISCTNFRSLEVIDRLERDLGKPVLTSNTTALWHTLRTAGYEGRGRLGGALLRERLSAARK